MTLVVLEPNSAAYEKCLEGLHNSNAAADQPALITQPHSESEVVEAIQLANRNNLQISVCSGSHSAHCARQDTLMLDLNKSMNLIQTDAEFATVQGGVSMGKLLKTLAPRGRMIPVGTHPTPGFGLLTMGGVGHLTRSQGLTLDRIEELKGITANGEVFSINSKDSDRELWSLLRGAAIFLAVIIEAKVRTSPRQPIRVARQLHNISKLAELIAMAETLPRQASCSLILGYCGDQLQVLSYAVAHDADASTIIQYEEDSSCHLQIVDGLEQLPDFDMPNQNASIPALEPITADRKQRIRTKTYSISHPANQIQFLGKALTDSIQSSPNRDCRIDMQHVGGVDRDVEITATAYRGRQAEWSIVITAVWPANDETTGVAARQWADNCFDALSVFANHYYIVQRHPGTHRYEKELMLAYGPILETLRARKEELDPDKLLPTL